MWMGLWEGGRRRWWRFVRGDGVMSGSLFDGGACRYEANGPRGISYTTEEYSLDIMIIRF